MVERVENFCPTDGLNCIHTFIPAMPEPGFESEEMMKLVWGRKWGVGNDIGRMRAVLVHRPGEEMKIVDPFCWDAEIGAIIDKERNYYFCSKEAPNLTKMQKEHDGLTQALKAEGVEVFNMADTNPRHLKAMFTRDPLVMIKGGAIVSRMAAKMRRGEELAVTRKLAEFGVPILHTIHGTGLFEGGSYGYINARTAVIGMSLRVNDLAADQIESVLRMLGVELIRVPLPGYDIHIDGAFVLVDVDLAVVDSSRLPYWFIQRLADMKIKTIERAEGDAFGVNCLAVSPGKVFMSTGNASTVRKLRAAGVEVAEIDYAEVQKNGGGIHCSTMPLIRDDV